MATDRLPNHIQMETLNEHLSTIASKISDPYSSQHKLASDLVDDTNQTNKFATAAQLEQITANENNILSLNKYGGGKNLLDVTASTTTISNVTFTVNADKSISITGSNTTGSYIEFPLGDFTAVGGGKS